MCKTVFYYFILIRVASSYPAKPSQLGLLAGKVMGVVPVDQGGPTKHYYHKGHFGCMPKQGEG